jgi:glucose/mannose-6-phosphate isomerase
MNLDDINKIKQLDKSNMAGSVEELYLQLEQTWEDIQTIKVPPQYKTAKNVVVAGMGGSALGPHVIKSLYFDRLSIPLEIVNDYHLPEYVNKDALVLLSSNSGTTEEVLSAAEDADKRGAMIMGMTTGGKLKKFLEIKKVPAYIFQQRHNPSGQPRMGTGYMILGMLGLFHQAGLIKIGESEVKTSIGLLKKLNKEWGLDTESNKNKAKQFAKQCHGKAVFTVSSSFLLGNAHTFNNQLNENAKNFSSFFALPEINHHLEIDLN